ncbi:MAG TPA: hypothetical protein DIT64_11315 [Verrucomicrobiales bacterium]|nr:hypothetical protein [Verrucomicrobiales bacterium]
MKIRGSLAGDVAHGAFGFALVGVASFSIWACCAGWFQGRGGEPAMYAAIALAFLALSVLVLAPLAGGAGRFMRAFYPAFLAYAVLWSAAWFAMPNRAGEWTGAALGCLVFAWLLLRLLGRRGGWLASALVFFALHTVGYFAGSWAMYDYWLGGFKAGQFADMTRAQAALYAKLSWGLCYGLGFGAGIGLLMHGARRKAA